jgi:hypothetical protein
MAFLLAKPTPLNVNHDNDPLLNVQQKAGHRLSITHSHINFNQPAAGITFDDIKTLEARDQSGSALSPISREA